MTALLKLLAAVLLALSCNSVAAFVAADPGAAPAAIPANILLLTPPPADGPLIVQSAFELHDLNQISEVEETFEFTGVLKLVWRDPRLAFTPTGGVDELVYQGNYQFDEIATGWYPTVVLANESGMFDVSGVVLRVSPDGTCTLIQTINATAESEMNMRLFPFDKHRLEAVFTLVGFDRDQVRLEVTGDGSGAEPLSGASLPHWFIKGMHVGAQDTSSAYAGRAGNASALVVSIDVERDSFYIRRLISFPLAVIVLLSFSVFWMERSSLGDRTSVSFIGILTGVSYQLVMGDALPEISYFTVMHVFLLFSFLTMCTTVVINLWVGALDKKGKYELGDRIDRQCRWIFPLCYIAFNSILYVFAEVIY